MAEDWEVALKYNPWIKPENPTSIINSIGAYDHAEAAGRLADAQAFRTKDLLPYEEKEKTADTSLKGAQTGYYGAETAEKRQSTDRTGMMYRALDDYQRTGDPKSLAAFPDVLYKLAQTKSAIGAFGDLSLPGVGVQPAPPPAQASANPNPAMANPANVNPVPAPNAPATPPAQAPGGSGLPIPPAPPNASATTAPVVAGPPTASPLSAPNATPAANAPPAAVLPTDRQATALPAETEEPAVAPQRNDAALARFSAPQQGVIKAIADGTRPLSDYPNKVDRNNILDAVSAWTGGDLSKVRSKDAAMAMMPGKSPDGKTEGTWMIDKTGQSEPKFYPITQTSKSPSGGAVISDQGADLAAERMMNGDFSAITGMGRNAASMTKINNTLAQKATERWGDTKQAGLMLGTVKAEYAGRQAEQRVLGTQEGRISGAVASAEVLIPQARQWSDKVSRTNYPDFNKILLAGKEKTGDPDVIRYGVAMQGVLTTYASVMGRGNQQTTDLKYGEAKKNLDNAWSKGQVQAALDGMEVEMRNEAKAPARAREALRNSWNTPRVRNQGEFNQIMPGTKFIYVYPDGNEKEGTKQDQ